MLARVTYADIALIFHAPKFRHLARPDRNCIKMIARISLSLEQLTQGPLGVLQLCTWSSPNFLPTTLFTPKFLVSPGPLHCLLCSWNARPLATPYPSCWRVDELRLLLPRKGEDLSPGRLLVDATLSPRVPFKWSLGPATQEGKLGTIHFSHDQQETTRHATQPAVWGKNVTRTKAKFELIKGWPGRKGEANEEESQSLKWRNLFSEMQTKEKTKHQTDSPHFHWKSNVFWLVQTAEVLCRFLFHRV